jgi:hypothetical protein
MTRIARALASAVGSTMMLLCVPALAGAQSPAFAIEPIGRFAAAGVGAIDGVVQDENGSPVDGALVSALGVMTAFTKTDKTGRFELASLSPGPYLIRAHLNGFVAPHGQIVEVRASGRTSSSIALRHASAAAAPRSSQPAPILAAGVGVPSTPEQPAPDPPVDAGKADPGDDHSELAWRLRHLRRSILQEATTDDAFVAKDSSPEGGRFGPANAMAWAVGSPARLATSFFADTPFSGQLNLLTTSSFDTPEQLFSSANIPRGVAYVSFGAPAGSHADWAVHGALTQADISSWVVAGVYSTRGPARHRYDVGLSYATQRYDGGNPAALRDVTDGSRNAGAAYGFDTFTISPTLAVTYGARYDRYEYLDGKSLISPRVGLTISPRDDLRITTLVSSRAVAPGAEEFLPPGDNGVWLPPQRTFSSLAADQPLAAERTTHVELAVERDLGPATTLTFRAFRQHVDDQLLTLFGVDVPGLPAADVGHYFVTNDGDVDARGVATGIRTAVAGRLHGSIEYSVTRANWNPASDVTTRTLHVPSSASLRSGGIHNVATAIETDVPETATRVIFVYRISNAFARRTVDEEALLDSRFEVQVHQSLPFLDFSSAKWEMLIAVRNFFREAAAEQSLYDELLVVRPPKRIVGGLTMRF